jgi:hypothetical protein
VPTPLGHLLGGFAAGWSVAGPPADHSGRARALALGGLGMAADLDLLVGRHSQFTHSLGMTVLVGAAAIAWLARGRRHTARGVLVLAAAAAAAYGSHVLLDWLGQDATPPFGITALWPLTGRYYISGLDVFMGVSRRPWLPGHAWYDLLAVTREVTVLAPVALAAWWIRRPGVRQNVLPGVHAGRQPLPQQRGARFESESGDNS